MRLQFGAEAFNPPSHANLLFPNTSFTAARDGSSTNANAGEIVSARAPRNRQPDVKPIF